MAMVINSNIMSLNAQRNLTMSQGEQNQAMERLSSGKRINSAADDAAGLAISNRMTSQVRGLDQAVRNANDGISLIQTAEGALDETTNILQRMRELSIQSANGTYSDGNRSTINAEVQQLKAEIDRISDTTSFNGLNILDGTLGEVNLHVGENANQVIALEVGAIDSKNLGGGGADIIGQATSGTTLLADLQATLSAAAATEMRINGQDVLASGNITSTGVTLQDALDTFNSNLTGVEVGAYTEMDTTTKGTGVINGTNELKITLQMADGTQNDIEIRNTGSLQELADKINAQGGDALSASIDDDGNFNLRSDVGAQITIGGTGITQEDVLGKGMSAAAVQEAALTVTSLNGEAITIDYGTNSIADTVGINQREVAGEVNSSSTFTLATFDAGDMTLNGVELGSYDNTIDYNGGSAGVAGQMQDFAAFVNQYSDQTGVIASSDSAGTGLITLTSKDGSDISIDYRDGSTETDMRALTGFRETNHLTGAGGNVDAVDVSTVAGANKAIGIIDKALEQVSEVRGDLGAVNNRLDFTINNLSNVSENVAAARSRIEDADFAQESANLSRAQVLQQAGTAMLAQANAAPQQVLSLLQ